MTRQRLTCYVRQSTLPSNHISKPTNGTSVIASLSDTRFKMQFHHFILPFFYWVSERVSVCVSGKALSFFFQSYSRFGQFRLLFFVEFPLSFRKCFNNCALFLLVWVCLFIVKLSGIVSNIENIEEMIFHSSRS